MIINQRMFLLMSLFIFGTSFVFAEIYTFEDYARDFEMGIPYEQDEEFHFQKKEDIDTDNDDVIRLEATGHTFKIKDKQTEKYTEQYHPLDSRTNLYAGNKLKIYSEGKKVKSDYMTDDFQSSLNASYDLSKRIKINTGHISKYVNPNANLGDRKFYFNPSLSLTKNASLDYINSFNQANENVEQEVGLKIKPKIFHDAATFRFNAGANSNVKNNKVNSTFKFTTDIYF